MIAILLVAACVGAALIDLGSAIKAADPADLGPAYVCIVLANAICWPLGIVGDLLQTLADRRQ